MSGSDAGSGATRRTFGVILGGLAASTILGTTVVANAQDGTEPNVPAQKPPERGAARPGQGVCTSIATISTVSRPNWMRSSCQSRNARCSWAF